MSPTATAIACYLLAINIITFVAFGVDKHRARRGQWRIKESTLLLMAAAGGAAGAWAGMKAFRHKTRHTKFRVLVPLCLVAWVAALALAYWPN